MATKRTSRRNEPHVGPNESGRSQAAATSTISYSDEGVPAPFAYEYRAVYIPFRCRNSVAENLLAEDFAYVPRPTSGVTIAFKVSFHASHRGMDDFDILSFDGAFYWPMRIPSYIWSDRHLTEAEILQELKTGNRNVLRTFADTSDRSCPRPVREEEDLAGVRGLWRPDRKMVIGKARRLALANILLHGGKAWVRAGEPVYVNSSHWRAYAEVANTGADRTLFTQGQWLNVGGSGFRSNQDAFRRGEFSLADRYDEAQAIAAEHSLHMPGSKC